MRGAVLATPAVFATPFTALTLAALACTALSLAGCAATDANGVPQGTVLRSTSRVAPGQTGLEVVRWQVEDDGSRVEDALRAHAAPAMAGLDEAALRQNGFVMWPVKLEELDALLAEMGGSYLDVRTWFGQATAWREIAAAPCGNNLIEIDGRSRERAGAVARLMLRSWPLPMEDGTRIAVEVVPQIVTGEAQSSLLKNSERLSGTVLSNCAAELELERGVAWIITCDPTRQIELKLPDDTQPPPEIGVAPEGAPETAPQPEPTPQSTAPEPEPEPMPEQPAREEPTQPEPQPEPEPEPAPVPAPPPVVPPTKPAPPPAEPAPAPSGARAVPPPPPLQPAQPSNPRGSPVPPLKDPPLQSPDPATKKLAMLASILFAMQQEQPAANAQNPASGEPPAEPKTRKGPRIVTIGVQLLLAGQEGAGLPSRRTVLVLVPHVGNSPFPATPVQ